jgi:hypothetical protein
MHLAWPATAIGQFPAAGKTAVLPLSARKRFSEELFGAREKAGIVS